MLIELGGRPSRPVRLQPIWTSTLLDGVLHVKDPETHHAYTLEVDLYMNHHWCEESARCEQELERWKKFRIEQEKLQDLDRLNYELELEESEPILQGILTRLSYWQEFQVSQQHRVNHITKLKDKCRRAIANIELRESNPDVIARVSRAQASLCPWVRELWHRQEELETAEAQLLWIKG